MNYPEAGIVPLSALRPYQFCPRQCALIHVEQSRDETAKPGRRS